MEIIANEAVVTSFMRNGMPVVRYQTGDHVEWVKDQCACGSGSPQFKLLGRIDSQFNLWSCRLFLSDLEKAIKENLGDLPHYQVQLKTIGSQEILELKIPLKILKENLMDHFYEVSHDMKKTISKEYLSEHFVIEINSETDFLHNPRTGKVSSLIDLRSL
jgi:phenylacetate-coenzyme A ligase PaaK-like adenylate-forming protein